MSYIPSQSVVDIITQEQFYFIYACELFLEEETLRLHTGIGEIVVNGYTFLGTSGIGSVGDITESDDNSTDQSVELSLSGFDASLIQGMMIDKCRGRLGRIYWVVMDMSGNMAADIMFSGRLDAAVLELGGNQEDNRLSVTISGRNAEWARGGTARYTDESHQSRYPDDRFFYAIGQVSGYPLYWGAKKDGETFKYD